MSTYKPFTTSDVVVTPFKVNKTFTFQGVNELISPNVGIDRYKGKNIPYISGSDLTGDILKRSKSLIYDSAKQLYYTNYIRGKNGSPAFTSSILPDGVRVGQGGDEAQPSYINYLNNTLQADRVFPTASNDFIGVISIPSNLFGEQIKPGSFSWETTGSTNNKITDDGEGRLFNHGVKVGEIIYQHGLIMLTTYGLSIPTSRYDSAIYGQGLYSATDEEELDEFLSCSIVTCSFQSTNTIYESQYKCSFNPSEYNYTQNPSAISSSLNSGVLYDFLTGSYFQPYITTVGLYNNANQLVAVGKLAQPLQSSNTTDTTILVNLDL